MSFRRMVMAAASLAAASSLAASSAAAPVAPADAKASTCFRTSSVAGYYPVSEQVLNLRVSAREAFQLTLDAPCTGITRARQITVVSRRGSRICEGPEATVVATTPLGEERCVVKTIRRLSPEEAAAVRSGTATK